MTRPARTGRRRLTRLARLRERLEALPGYEGEIGKDIQPMSDKRLLDAAPRKDPPRIGALNMASVCAERTDGCGTVGCLAALTILEYPEEAAATRRQTARDYNLPEGGISSLDVAARILGLEPSTRDALFCGVGSKWFEDLGNAPKAAVVDALDRTIAGAVGAEIWADSHR